MAFTIHDEIPPLVYGLGQFVSIQIAMAEGSTPTPSGFTATGLPTGFSINGTTGKITGASTEPGVFAVTVTATGSGPVTDSVVFLVGITDRVGYDALLGGAVEMDMDIRSGFVSVVNTTGGEVELVEGNVLLYDRLNDKPQFAFGFVKDAELQDLLLVDLKILMFYSESDEDPVDVASGSWWKSGAYEAARYVASADLSSDEFADLFDEESDDGLAYIKTQVVATWHSYPPGVTPDDDPEPTPVVTVRTSQEFFYRVTA